MATAALPGADLGEKTIDTATKHAGATSCALCGAAQRWSVGKIDKGGLNLPLRDRVYDQQESRSMLALHRAMVRWPSTIYSTTTYDTGISKSVGHVHVAN